MPNDPAPFPQDQLRSATGDAQAHAAIDELAQALRAAPPDPARIEDHIERLRGWDSLVAVVESWYLDPRTQLFIADLSSAGL